MVKLYPSLMAADLLCLKEQINALDPLCDGYHLDIMDDHFVPNLTFGADMVQAIAAHTNKQIWLHLMIENVKQFLEKCTVPAHSLISFHIESQNKADEIINIIKENNWLPSIAINPKTNVERILPYLNIIDQVLIMSVEPGHSGQRFIPSVVNKVDQLLTIRKKKELSFQIGMDGGINQENISELARKGVDDFAIGSALFESDDIVYTMEQFKKLVQ